MKTEARSVGSRLADVPAVLEAVTRAAAAEYPPQSWVFTGAPGSGRSEAAVCLAAALVCEAGVGCGRCAACRKVFADAHADVVHVVPEQLSIGVDFVRDRVIADANRLPTTAPWRVVIIEDADRLSPNAADALLKTVEEPPSRTVIVFCAPSVDPKDFSQTLRSRCRHVYVPSRSVEEITRILVEEEGASEADARLASYASLRHIGRARRLVTSRRMQQRRAAVINLAELVFHGDQAFQAMYSLVKAMEKEAIEDFHERDEEELERLRRSVGVGARGKGTQKSVRGAAGLVRDLEQAQKRRTTRRRRDLLDLALVDLAGIYRDAYLRAIGSEVAPTHPDFAPLAEELAGRVSERGLVECLDAIGVARRHLGENVQFTIATDALIGRLRLACGVD